MVKIVITIATMLVSMISLAQITGKGLQLDIRGRDCMGGGGLCSVTPLEKTVKENELNKSDMRNYNIVKQTSKSLIIEIETSKLSVEDQKFMFGKEYDKITPDEELVFIQDQDYVFDIDTMIYLELDMGFRMIKRGSYPLQIVKDKVQVTINLSPYRDY